jgi:hypothetical protein
MVATVSASLTVGSLLGEHRNLSRRAGTVLPQEGHEGPPLRGTSPRHLNRGVATSLSPLLCPAADGCREQPLLAAILQEGNTPSTPTAC